MKKSKVQSVTYKSTKSELWSAYKKLSQLLKKQKRGKVVVQAPTSISTPDWREQLLKAVKRLDSQLEEKQEELNSVQEQISKSQEELAKLHQVKAKAQTLTTLEEKITLLENLYERKQEQLKQEFAQEKSWAQKRLEKEDEEARFNLELKRRKLEKEISQIEKEWREKEKHYQELQEETAEFPKILKEEKEKASQEVTAQLEKEFAQEKAMLLQKYQSSQQLLDQQIKNLLSKVKEQEDQIKALSGQLNGAHQRIKDLAVTALETKRPRIEKIVSSEEKPSKT